MKRRGAGVRSTGLQTNRLVGMLSGMPRTKESAKTKILDAAERVILRVGPTGLSVDAVVREAGVSKGGFFHHFATKEALLVAVLERLSSAVDAQVAAAMERGEAGLAAQVAIAFDMPAAERERTRALVLALLAGVMESPSIAAAARAANDKSLALATAAGVDAGTALIVQLVLDGFFLAESFGTLKLGPTRRKALRAALLRLIEANSQGASHGR